MKLDICFFVCCRDGSLAIVCVCVRVNVLLRKKNNKIFLFIWFFFLKSSLISDVTISNVWQRTRIICEKKTNDHICFFLSYLYAVGLNRPVSLFHLFSRPHALRRISGKRDLLFGSRDQQCCFGRPALIVGTLHKKREVLIRTNGGGEAIVPVLVFLYSTWSWPWFSKKKLIHHSL